MSVMSIMEAQLRASLKALGVPVSQDNRICPWCEGPISVGPIYNDDGVLVHRCCKRISRLGTTEWRMAEQSPNPLVVMHDPYEGYVLFSMMSQEHMFLSKAIIGDLIAVLTEAHAAQRAYDAVRLEEEG